MKYLILFIIFFLFVIPGFSLEWPVKGRALLSTFGENRGGGFYKGIDIGNGRQEIHPVGSGEIIFYLEERDSYSGIPSGLGSFIVLEHDRGLRSLYGHIESGSIITDKELVVPEDIIGYTGESGAASGKYLHFEIIDMEFNQVVNPLLLLPPVLDLKSPVIESIIFERDNVITRVESGMTIPSGSVDLILDIRDYCENISYSRPMAPYSIDLFLNGEGLFQVSFEALKERDGILYLIQSDNSYSTYYHSKWGAKLGSILLNSGETRLEVITKDIAGNENTKMLVLNIQ